MRRALAVVPPVGRRRDKYRWATTPVVAASHAHQAVAAATMDSGTAALPDVRARLRYIDVTNVELYARTGRPYAHARRRNRQGEEGKYESRKDDSGEIEGKIGNEGGKKGINTDDSRPRWRYTT